MDKTARHHHHMRLKFVALAHVVQGNWIPTGEPVVDHVLQIDLTSAAFWIAVAQIIMIDILLGGDNAVVIALACRKLPEEQRRKGIFYGVAGAIGLRVVLIFFAVQLLTVPYLKIIGGVLLFWIGVKLLIPEDDDGHGNIAESTTLWGAIKTIIVADAVMSLDNVIAVAGAANGNMGLVVFGILVSIPIVVWGSKLVLTLMDKYPQVITFGGGLLGWIGGGMLLTDIAVPTDVVNAIPYAKYIASAAGAAFVVVLGKIIASQKIKNRVAAPVDLATGNPVNSASGKGH